MDFEIAHSEGFPLELGRAPKKVQHAIVKTIYTELRSHPDQADPPRIKRLQGYKHLWRYRVADDYRLVYRVDPASRLVTLIMIGHRGAVYDRLGVNDAGEPGIRIVATAPELLEKEPSPEQIGEATLALAKEAPAPAAATADAALPSQLTNETLSDWAIPQQHHAALMSAKSEGDLLALAGSVPDAVIERVMNGLWPPRIEEIAQRPIRLSSDAKAVDDAAQGTRSLSSFLLQLDDDQKAFVARFERDSPKGPWLVKGGPGSGKSTVALYCMRALLRHASEQLPNPASRLRILFTTFTHSLISASRMLLDSLDANSGAHEIHIDNVDRLTRRAAPQHVATLTYVKRTDQWQPLLEAAIAECRRTDTNFAFAAVDRDFLFEEIDWVVYGQGMRTVEEYLAADRPGRGRRLGVQQRRQLWRVFDIFHRKLRDGGLAMWSDVAAEAARVVRPRYDYVFIDEAQDLKPVAIRFCLGLCKQPEGVFLTADGNQSIYGSGMSWSSVATSLRFTGRARTLNRNYRTTKEIWQALAELAPNSSDADPETLTSEAVFNGPWPRFARYDEPTKQAARLNAFLTTALREERVGPGCAAILCPPNTRLAEVARWIDKRFNAKPMASDNFDPQHHGVKVTTMHASKGLQFPVVAVVGVEDGRMPRPAGGGVDTAEHSLREQRLLFVACSRAMRQLLVMGSRSRPSPFVEKLTDTHWEIEDL